LSSDVSYKQSVTAPTLMFCGYPESRKRRRVTDIHWSPYRGSSFALRCFERN